jgi:hypothetical protein
VKAFFLDTQWPEDLEDRNQPGQRWSFALRRVTGLQPMSNPGYRLVEKGNSRLGVVQANRPAPDSGGIGQAIGVFKLRHCLFARTLFHYALEKCLAASEQAVVRVRERKHRQEGKGRLALGAAATTNLDPVVILVMSLLATAPVAVDRIAVTNRTMAYDSRVAVFGPVGGKFRQRDGDWDELNRNSQGFRPGVDPPRSRPEPEPLLLKKTPTERKYTSEKACFNLLAGYLRRCTHRDSYKRNTSALLRSHG